ncbi:MAG: hypothetical protein GWQ05_22950 [Verrucomicrobiaceae bacterium]|nr:hypothetical protein [Verrucomicrobiaceae bacterium]NCF93789.1 hypothetical protein [Verrucomicrobiaceae bacterium]
MPIPSDVWRAPVPNGTKGRMGAMGEGDIATFRTSTTSSREDEFFWSNREIVNPRIDRAR